MPDETRQGFRETINAGGSRTIGPKPKAGKPVKAKAGKPAKGEDPASSAVTMPESGNTGAGTAAAAGTEG